MITTDEVGHVARPSKVNINRCAVCNRLITVTVGAGGRRYVHKDTVLFNAERQKELHERLDAIAAGLKAPRLTLPELLKILETLHTWRLSPQAWNAVNRWARTHGGSVHRVAE